MESYDGADAIERAWRDGLTPDPLLTVSEWADRYRVLSQRASSEPFSRYLVGIELGLVTVLVQLHSGAVLPAPGRPPTDAAACAFVIGMVLLRK
jgi:hypothetical protein